jgi:ABC-type transporter Mla MlaB component|tara:strand:- start:2800 stop:3102 length:303 start_codon:yes stop_codon:yes gene_type:complete
MDSAEIIQLARGHLKVTGTLTLSNVPHLRDQGAELIEDGPDESRIDLSEAIFQGSAGLALLTSWLRLAEAAAKQIEYLNPPETLQKIAVISEIGDILNLR